VQRFAARLLNTPPARIGPADPGRLFFVRMPALSVSGGIGVDRGAAVPAP
jgi:hypothetical protein